MFGTQGGEEGWENEEIWGWHLGDFRLVWNEWMSEWRVHEPKRPKDWQSVGVDGIMWQGWGCNTGMCVGPGEDRVGFLAGWMFYISRNTVLIDVPLSMSQWWPPPPSTVISIEPRAVSWGRGRWRWRRSQVEGGLLPFQGWRRVRKGHPIPLSF